MTIASAICVVIGLIFSLLVVPQIIRFASDSPFLQRAPDQHHTNTVPVPRLGGLALASAFILLQATIFACFPHENSTTRFQTVVVLSSLAMFAVGLWDDVRPIGAKWKLAAQVLISLAVWWFGVGIQQFRVPFTEQGVHLGAWSCLVTVVWLVGMTNLINLIDGVDGLAGGICLMLMALLAYIGHQQGSFGLLSAGMAGAILGFLRYNFPPARIYMGDGGAYFLGFLIGIFSLVNSHKGTIAAALIAPLFVLALPILDTTLAILRRGLRGLPIFRPDRRHIHHRLLGTGMSRRKVVLLLYGFSLVFMLFGVAAFWSNAKLVPILLGVSIMILLLCAGKFQFSREWFSVGRVVGNSLEMRKQVQYATALSRWLVLEGARSAGLDPLWEDFLFAARKLGFSAVTITLNGDQRSWRGEPVKPPAQSWHYPVKGGQYGTIELTAHQSVVFEVLSELLAEAWGAAAAEMAAQRGKLQFETQTDEGRAIPSHPASRQVLAGVPEEARP